MPAHLRVSLADRPGALAALTRSLAAAGANVLSVTVLQREAGRAVDDLLLDWPFERRWDSVLRAVEGCAGARLHGLRHIARDQPVPDSELMAHVLQRPHRALEVTVDMLPAMLLADWAALADRRWAREPVLSSPHTPMPLPLLPPAVPRPRALVVDDAPVLVVPIVDSELRLLVGRTAGPAFARTEKDRCVSAVDVVVNIVRLAYRDEERTPPTSITQHVLDGERVPVG